MRKNKNKVKFVVDARECARNLFRANGKPKALSIANGCLKASKERTGLKLFSDKELVSLEGFWTNVVGVINKL